MHPKDNFERDENQNLVLKDATGDLGSKDDTQEATAETSSTSDAGTQPLEGSDVSPDAE